MKIVVGREMQKNQQKITGRKEQGGTEALVKGWQLNDFVVRFLQLICKASLIFRSNLDLALLF